MPTHGVHQDNQLYSSSRHSLTISGVFIKASIVCIKVLFQVIITIKCGSSPQLFWLDKCVSNTADICGVYVHTHKHTTRTNVYYILMLINCAGPHLKEVLI